MNKAILEHITGTVVLLSVTAATFWGAVLPVWTRSASQAQAIADAAQQRTAATELARSLSAAQNKLRVAKTALLTFDQPCWTDADRSRRIERVYRVAHDAGLQVEGVEPSDAERVGGRRVLPMRLSARGGFASTVQTLAEIRKTQPDVVVRTLDMVAAPGTEGQLMINIELLWVPPAADPNAKPSTPRNSREASVR